MTTHVQKEYEALAKQCVTSAKEALGPGWNHVSQEIRWGLVCANIIALHEAQDTDNSFRIVAMIRHVTELCQCLICE